MCVTLNSYTWDQETQSGEEVWCYYWGNDELTEFDSSWCAFTIFKDGDDDLYFTCEDRECSEGEFDPYEGYEEYGLGLFPEFKKDWTIEGPYGLEINCSTIDDEYYNFQCSTEEGLTGEGMIFPYGEPG
jgi:hypothetical protein